MDLESFKSIFPQLVQILIQSINSKNTQENSLRYLLYFDNVVSAFGKSIQVMWDKLDVDQKVLYIDLLINNLPLLKDKKEGYNMNTFLIKLINSPDYQLVFGQGNKNFARIMHIFRKSYMKEELSDNEMNQSIAQIVKGLQENALFRSSFQQLNQEKFIPFMTKIMK